MIIKPNSRPSFLIAKFVKNIIKIFLDYKWQLSFIIINLILTISISLVFSSNSIKLKLKDQLGSFTSLVHRPIDTINNYFNGLFYSDYKTIYIDINFENKKKLDFLSQLANEGHGTISEDKKLYVPAELTYNNQKYKISVRIKGDFADHTINPDKRSLRVKLKNNKTIFGMRKFSLQHPSTRGYLYDWFCHKAFKIESIIALRYDFLKIYINGEDKGIFAIEEHFDKRLVEDNQRKESPIIRFDENNYFKEYRNFYQDTDPSIGYMNPSGYGSFNSSGVKSFKSFENSDDPVVMDNLISGHTLLEAFMDKRLKASEVFNVEKFTSYLAMIQLLKGHHGSNWHNIRFYYNPFTLDLEPIAFDMYNERKSYSIFFEEDKNGFFEILFSDLDFYKLYIQKLNKYSEKEFLDSLLNNLKDELERVENIIYSEWPTYFFDLNEFYKNSNYIRSIIDPEEAIRATVHYNDDQLVELEISNLQRMKIKIENITFNGRITHKNIRDLGIVDGSKNDEIIEKSIIQFTKVIDDSIDFNDAYVNYRIFGLNKSYKKKISTRKKLNNENFKKFNNYKKSNVDNFQFLLKDEKNKSIVFKSKSIVIDKDLVIPKGYTVHIEKNTKIDLINSSSIISYSNIISEGTKDSYVIFTSSDRTGQGISIIEAKRKSNFIYTAFANLQSIKKLNYTLTSAITFYESEVNFKNCKFLDNINGDDLLNIVRSDFLISNSEFINSYADALDIDFANGALNNVRFENCGNDCIDISGSEVGIDKIEINYCQDKGISAGERSNLIGEKVEINNAEIAICSKDLSIVEIKDVKIVNSNVGITAFQKKPEYGSGYISLYNVFLDSINHKYFIEEESYLLMDNFEVDIDKIKNVENLLYGAQFGKASKR